MHYSNLYKNPISEGLYIDWVEAIDRPTDYSAVFSHSAIKHLTANEIYAYLTHLFPYMLTVMRNSFSYSRGFNKFLTEVYLWSQEIPESVFEYYDEHIEEIPSRSRIRIEEVEYQAKKLLKRYAGFLDRWDFPREIKPMLSAIATWLCYFGDVWRREQPKALDNLNISYHPIGIHKFMYDMDSMLHTAGIKLLGKEHYKILKVRLLDKLKVKEGINSLRLVYKKPTRKRKPRATRKICSQCHEKLDSNWVCCPYCGTCR